MSNPRKPRPISTPRVERHLAAAALILPRIALDARLAARVEAERGRTGESMAALVRRLIAQLPG